MLWLDGMYDANVEPPRRKPRLRRARAPTSAQLTQLANTIAHRVCRHLSRRGWLEGEDESVFLSDSAGSDDGMDGLRMSSMTYRIATGRDAGRKVVTLQTLPGDAGSLEGDAGKVGGFSLHAGVAAEAHESHKLEKLCRYITRPAISEQRLSISPQGRVRYQLKTPWRNGTTHVEWDAVDFIAKLAALVPPPRAHLTRFHGVFAPNANLRAQLTPSGRGKRPAGDAAPVDVSAHDEPRSPEQKRRAMSWAQRLKRVFPSTSPPAPTAAAPCGSSPASRNLPPSAPSLATSRSTARWSKRTTGPQRARRRRPRDEVPATQPAAKPESDPMRPRSAGRRSARCRESAKHGC
ncbi:transposase [Aeromonas caviae]|nr:transposase [Aeromonas caviae]ULH02022.1 transposase [Aeromonas caviae]